MVRLNKVGPGFVIFLSLVCHAFMCGCHDALHVQLRIHVPPRHPCVAFYIHTRKRQFRFMVKVDSVFKNKVAWGSQHVHFVVSVCECKMLHKFRRLLIIIGGLALVC